MHITHRTEHSGTLRAQPRIGTDILTRYVFFSLPFFLFFSFAGQVRLSCISGYLSLSAIESNIAFYCVTYILY